MNMNYYNCFKLSNFIFKCLTIRAEYQTGTVIIVGGLVYNCFCHRTENVGVFLLELFKIALISSITVPVSFKNTSHSRKTLL